MLATRYVLRFVLLGLGVSFGAFGATAPGTLEGDFAVGDQGEGTYTIPIAAPASQGFPGRFGSPASLPLYIIESLLLYSMVSD